MKVYYNDNDKFCCAWLRELIAAKLIPAGDVDERSICDLEAGDVRGYGQCHFFAGIGGWSLALQLAQWPEGREVWTGSCPCQPLSCAGQRKGHADERHLWPDFYRIIAKCKPATVFGEQVASKDGREWLAGIRADLEGMEYAVGGADLCAAGLAAPHRRQRLFWVADSNGGQSGDGRLQRGGRHLQRAGGENGVDRLANSAQRGQRTDRSAPGQSRHAQQREQAGGVGYADSSRRGESRRAEPIRSQQLPAEYGSDTSGLVQSNGPGSQSRDETAKTAGYGSSAIATNFWSDAIWIPTRDPKTGEIKMRRISPQRALFPLAARLPGRVGMLRGVGNAICVPVAAEFVKAFLETER